MVEDNVVIHQISSIALSLLARISKCREPTAVPKPIASPLGAVPEFPRNLRKFPVSQLRVSSHGHYTHLWKDIGLSPRLVGRGLVIVLWLVEKEVCSQLLVLVAGKVSLDRLVTIKAKPTQLEATSAKSMRGITHPCTYSFNSISLFLSDSDGLGSRGQRDIIVSILAQQLKKLVGI